MSRRSLVAMFTLAVVGALVAVTHISLAAGPEEPDALQAAAAIPNDQGPSNDCTPAPTRTSKPSPATPSAPPVPSTKPSQPDDPSPQDPSPSKKSDDGADADADADTGASASAGASADAHALHRGDRSASPSPSASSTCHTDQGGPTAADFVDIRSVQPNVRAPRVGRDGSRGTFVSVCGTNENGHFNSDNFITAPGVTNGAHHTHDYVGNVSTDGSSTNDSLAAAGTTCRFGDRSTYFWPVLRRTDRPGNGTGADGNVGRVLRPDSVRLEFRGNTQTKVRAIPQFIRIITGDAKAHVNGPTNARAQWTCTGFTDRTTTKYPLCPRGSQVQRILDFPSCWDGTNTDSTNHRSHIVFPGANGRCPRRTTAVPQLRITLTFSVPGGRNFALDSFPEQLHDPLTDHADFVNVMPANLMAFAVGCINAGRRCGA
jgi:hypothetical protein